MLWFYSHYFYIWLVRTRKLTAQGWWHVRPYPNYHNTFTFWTYGELPYVWGRMHTCQYNGEMNALRQPHGWGQWIDDSKSGERLNGWWQDGIPIGPFVSREFRTGYAFTCLRVGYAMAREDSWTESARNPVTGPLKVRVACPCPSPRSLLVRTGAVPNVGRC